MTRNPSATAGQGGVASWPWQAAVVAVVVGLASPASALQSALAPASAQAEGIARLWWVMLWGGTAIFIAVIALLAAGLWRSRHTGGLPLSRLASRNLVIAAGVAIPLAILIALVAGSLLLGRSIATSAPANALHIRVTGWMWWWEVEYLDESGRVLATTANELHVPVGRPVRLSLVSGDVIHSFWTPPLHGKTDLVPGTVNSTWFTASQPGTWRGQCAEFCGTQHALMGFVAMARPAAEFRQWLENQSRPARPPATPQARRGLGVFLDAHCAGCHTIRGTPARGELGPDLTHVASRSTLAAAARPNTRGHLAGWISDPQGIKPGNRMPRTPLEPAELHSLLAYLEQLR